MGRGAETSKTGSVPMSKHSQFQGGKSGYDMRTTLQGKDDPRTPKPLGKGHTRVPQVKRAQDGTRQNKIGGNKGAR